MDADLLEQKRAKRRVIAKAYREKHPDRVKAARKKYNQANAEARIAASSQWRRDNPERHRELAAKARARRRASPHVRVNDAVRVAIRQSLSGTKRRRAWESLVGYGLADLVAHLERQFTKGMSWENYGDWHVDHITPLAAFSIAEAHGSEFRAAWSLANLRPMWARENQAKGGRRVVLL